MQLTTEMVQRFVGGQLEIREEYDDYDYCGEIAAITVENNELRVRFAWFAKGDVCNPIVQKWVKENLLNYFVDLKIYSATVIGHSVPASGDDRRILLDSDDEGDIYSLYPPNDRRLDPRLVEGLQLARA